MRADLIVRSGHPASNCLYRLGLNALLFAEHDVEHEQARKLQAALGAPQEDTTSQPTLVGSNLLAAGTLSLLERQPVIALARAQEAVRNIFPRGTATEESLVEWQAPRLSLRYHINIRMADASDRDDAAGEMAKLEVRQLLQGGAVGLHLDVEHSPLRDLRPGEAFGTVESQMKRIIVDVASKDPPGMRQAELDRTTERVGQSIQAQVTQAGCFPTPVKVQVQVQASRVRGEAIRTSSGEETVVPSYALDGKDARLAAYLASLRLLGISATFTPWRLAERSGLYLAT